MLDFFWPVLLAIAAIYSVVATALPNPTNLINVSSDIPILTVLGGIDPRFHISMTSAGTEILSTDSSLLAITKMLYELTLSDFNGMIEPSTYVLGATSVSLRGSPGDMGIQTRYAVWGIYRASLYVVRTKIARSYAFSLTFDNSHVGYIDFARTQVQLSPATSSSRNAQNRTQSLDTSPLARSSASSLQSSGYANLTSPSERPIEIIYDVIRDQDLTKWELFANIYTFLGTLAEFPSPQRIERPYITHSPPFPRSRTGFEPKTYPSVVENRHAALAFTTMASFITTLDVVHGITVQIKLDNEVIGEGFIKRLPSQGHLRYAAYDQMT